MASIERTRIRSTLNIKTNPISSEAIRSDGFNYFLIANE